MEYTTSRKTVKKWDKQLIIKHEKPFKHNKVILSCSMCKKYEKRKKNMRKFNPTWLIGSKYIKKYSLQKHIIRTCCSGPIQKKHWGTAAVNK